MPRSRPRRVAPGAWCRAETDEGEDGGGDVVRLRSGCWFQPRHACDCRGDGGGDEDGCDCCRGHHGSLGCLLVLLPRRRVVLLAASRAHRLHYGPVRVSSLLGQRFYRYLFGTNRPQSQQRWCAGALEALQRCLPGLSLRGVVLRCRRFVCGGTVRHRRDVLVRQRSVLAALACSSQRRTSRSGSAHSDSLIRAMMSTLNCWWRLSAVSRSVMASRMASASCDGPLPP